MRIETIEKLMSCKLEEEAKITCSLMGDVFEEKIWNAVKDLEDWEKSLVLYDFECREKKIPNILL